jgi:signal transduction histidine kinase
VDAPDTAVGAGHAADGRVGPDPADQARLRQIAEEQAALRRVATLVARGTPPEQVFAAVTEEYARLVPVDAAAMARFEPDDTVLYVASWGKAVDFIPVGSRWTQVEVAAYYAVSEALANAAKHAHASAVHVELDAPDATLRLSIRDDGIGGADPARGSGLTGLRDRIEAVGGTFDVTSPAGGGTTLLIEIPV